VTPRLGLALLAAAALAGCAHALKPKELLDLAALRATKESEVAQEQQPDLWRDADAPYWKAIDAWQRSNVEEAQYWATLGAIKLRTALNAVREEAARRRVEETRKQLAELRGQQQALRAELGDVEEQLRLYEKLAAARRAAKEKEQQLSEAQQRQQAQARLRETQMALKMAETVEAARYAPADYVAAQSLLAAAEAALRDGRVSDAAATAEVAKAKADAALTVARPLYLAERKAAERQARNQALQKDAAAIAGITVRMRAIGETQQLILPVPDLFRRGDATPRPDKLGLLDAIGALVKKYGEYPVIINGYTSSRVRAAQQYALSQARAQKVADRLVSQGVEASRIAVTGRAADDPIAARSSPLNDRVEIILLFQ
jgi:outer membrane protein OmpA-like peptidoglycan-associated protein